MRLSGGECGPDDRSIGSNEAVANRRTGRKRNARISNRSWKQQQQAGSRKLCSVQSSNESHLCGPHSSRCGSASFVRLAQRKRGATLQKSYFFRSACFLFYFVSFYLNFVSFYIFCFFLHILFLFAYFSFCIFCSVSSIFPPVFLITLFLIFLLLLLLLILTV